MSLQRYANLGPMTENTQDRTAHAPTTSGDRREVTVERLGAGFVARNAEGNSLEFGDTAAGQLNPIEMLLAAIGGCAAIDVVTLTDRRAETTTFQVTIGADKLRDELHNHLGPVDVRFDVRFDGPGKEDAESVLPNAVRMAQDRLCTVSRTVSLGTPVDMGLVSDTTE